MDEQNRQTLSRELEGLRENRSAPPMKPPAPGTNRSRQQRIQSRANKRRKARGWRQR